MTEAAAQAKQLDSVTDMVKETELDASKAQEAMTALSTDKADQESDQKKAAALASVNISKDDVELIVSEMEVTKEIAEKLLREVALTKTQPPPKEGEVLEEVLRKLVTSSE